MGFEPTPTCGEQIKLKPGTFDRLATLTAIQCLSVVLIYLTAKELLHTHAICTCVTILLSPDT